MPVLQVHHNGIPRSKSPVLWYYSELRLVDNQAVSFRAVHRRWGTIFAHLRDLGCGQAWESIWRVSPPAPLVCDECGHPMHPKVSRAGLRFFAHARGRPTCELAEETLAHHLLKLELATAAKAAGAHAELEVPAADGSWRADVLASDHVGTWKMALEAQLSSITSGDILARTNRMQFDGVGVCWFSDRSSPPWFGVVPSIRLTWQDDGPGLHVADGLYRFVESWQPVEGTTLTDFLGWVFAGRAFPHSPYRRVGLPPRWRSIWTAAQYVAAERRVLTEDEQIRTPAEALEDAITAEAAARRRPEAVRLRQKVQDRRPMLGTTIRLLNNEHDIEVSLGWCLHDRRYALGDPLVDHDGVPVAVFGPVGELVRGTTFLLLSGLLLLFPAKADLDQFMKMVTKTKHIPAEGFRTNICSTDY